MYSPGKAAPDQLLGHDATEPWQEQPIESNDTAGTPGIVGLLFNELIVVLKAELDQGKQHPSDESSNESLDSILATLFFWGVDHGVLHGELDKSLEDSMFLRDTVLEILISISECVYTRRYHRVSKKGKQRLLEISDMDLLIQSAKSALHEPEKTVSYIHHDIDDLPQTLKRKVDSLIILSSSLESPAPDRIVREYPVDGEGVQGRPSTQFTVMNDASPHVSIPTDTKVAISQSTQAPSSIREVDDKSVQKQRQMSGSLEALLSVPVKGETTTKDWEPLNYEWKLKTEDQMARRTMDEDPANDESADDRRQKQDIDPPVQRCQGCGETWRRPLPDLDRHASPAENMSEQFMLTQDLVTRLRSHTKKVEEAYSKWVWTHTRCPIPQETPLSPADTEILGDSYTTSTEDGTGTGTDVMTRTASAKRKSDIPPEDGQRDTKSR